MFSRPGLTPLRPLLGTLIGVENKLKIDISVDVRLDGQRLVFTVAPLNDVGAEVRHETSIIQPSVNVTEWVKGGKYQHGA